MKKQIDINCDIGEDANPIAFSRLDQILPFISSGNVACGFHAGSPDLMRKTMEKLLVHNVRIGAHPSFNDRENFGRKELLIEPTIIYNEVLYQIAAAAGVASAVGGVLSHVKPHGALYNMAAVRSDYAGAVVNAILDFDKNLKLYGLAGSTLLEYGRASGLVCASEVFADRNYESDGSLISRKKKNAIIVDEKSCVEHILKILENGYALTPLGRMVYLEADTICLHGDNVDAPLFAQKLHESLTNRGFEIGPPYSKNEKNNQIQ